MWSEQLPVADDRDKANSGDFIFKTREEGKDTAANEQLTLSKLEKRVVCAGKVGVEKKGKGFLEELKAAKFDVLKICCLIRL